jgi:hypothetical protein
MYFDGSDVELATADEDVDGLFIRESESGGLPQLFLSTRGVFAAGAASGDNEDVLRFAPTRLGGTTAGSYSLPLDGSAYGLAPFDLDGIHIGSVSNQWLLGASSSAASLPSRQPANASRKETGDDAQPVLNRGDLLLSALTLEPTTRSQASPTRLIQPRPNATISPSAEAVDFLLATLAARQRRIGVGVIEGEPSEHTEPDSALEETASDDARLQRRL